MFAETKPGARRAEKPRPRLHEGASGWGRAEDSGQVARRTRRTWAGQSGRQWAQGSLCTWPKPGDVTKDGSIIFPDAGHTPRVLMLLPFSLKLMQHDCLQKYSSNLMLKGEKERQINN